MCDGAVILPRTTSWAVCFANSSALLYRLHRYLVSWNPR